MFTTSSFAEPHFDAYGYEYRVMLYSAHDGILCLLLPGRSSLFHI